MQPRKEVNVGVRFQRRIKIAKGVSLNVSKSGFGISAGPRGAKIGIGPRGTHYSGGLPGTGLAYRKQTGSSSARPSTTRRSSGSPGSVAVEIKVSLDSDGKVNFLDSNGNPLPPKVVKQVKQNSADDVRRFLEEQCQRINGGIEEIQNIHASTPSPARRIRYRETPFRLSKPSLPVLQHPGLLDRLFPGRQARVEEANRAAEEAWRDDLAKWGQAKARHEAIETELKGEFEQGLLEDQSVMTRVLEERLAGLEWPRETDLSYEFEKNGKVVWLDIDLPEVEDMPKMKAAIAASGFKVNIKNKSETQVRKDYMQFVHAILFRAIGETFYSLPALQGVIASCYSQRPDPATGQVQDEYLISVRVSRSEWQGISFDNLGAVDLITCLEQFELRRNMTKAGVFKPIEPLSQAD